LDVERGRHYHLITLRTMMLKELKNADGCSGLLPFGPLILVPSAIREIGKCP